MSLYGDTAIHKDYQLDLWRYASRTPPLTLGSNLWKSKAQGLCSNHSAPSLWKLEETQNSHQALSAWCSMTQSIATNACYHRAIERSALTHMKMLKSKRACPVPRSTVLHTSSSETISKLPRGRIQRSCHSWFFAKKVDHDQKLSLSHWSPVDCSPQPSVLHSQLHSWQASEVLPHLQPLKKM